MINLDKTNNVLKIDIAKLKSGSVVKVYWQCDSCNLEKLKPYRDCLTSHGLCVKCHRVRVATMMGNKFGKAQQMQGKCLYCDTIIRSTHVTCKEHNKSHLTKILSGNKNPAWSGRNVCQCSKKKSTHALKCRNCSFKDGDRSGNKNGRWVEDRGKILSARIARTILSNTLKITNQKKVNNTLNTLKYSFNDLKLHMEGLFEPWMNWSNRGNGKDKWSVDHIIPITVLVRHGITDPSIINALWNLRPLRASLNVKRSNKIDDLAKSLAKDKLNLEV